MLKSDGFWQEDRKPESKPEALSEEKRRLRREI